MINEVSPELDCSGEGSLKDSFPYTFSRLACHETCAGGSSTESVIKPDCKPHTHRANLNA